MKLRVVKVRRGLVTWHLESVRDCQSAGMVKLLSTYTNKNTRIPNETTKAVIVEVTNCL